LFNEGLLERIQKAKDRGSDGMANDSSAIAWIEGLESWK